MGDLNLSNLTKQVKEYNKLLNYKTNLILDLKKTDTGIVSHLKEITEILEYWGISGSYRDIIELDPK